MLEFAGLKKHPPVAGSEKSGMVCVDIVPVEPVQRSHDCIVVKFATLGKCYERATITTPKIITPIPATRMAESDSPSNCHAAIAVNT